MNDDRRGQTVGGAGTWHADDIRRWVANAGAAIQASQRQVLLVMLGYVVTTLALIRMMVDTDLKSCSAEQLAS